MTEETRMKLSLPELVEPPMKPYMNPFPPKGRIYDYKFVKEVRKCMYFITISHICYDIHFKLLLSEMDVNVFSAADSSF